jgi:hypothetical protein
MSMIEQARVAAQFGNLMAQFEDEYFFLLLYREIEIRGERYGR